MSEIAKKLIAKNLKKKEKSLDLGKCGLTDFNAIPELFDCMHLQELILSSDWAEYDSEYQNYERYRTRNTKKPNKIAGFPIQFTQLKNLKILRADRIGLENIDILGEIPQLEYLSVSGGIFKEMACLQNLKNLYGLDVSSNFWLNRDYTCLESLTSLKFLNICESTVNSRDFLASLTDLRRLYIYSQFCTDISPLANLKKLTFLQANRNQIEDISALKNLTQLETLFLGSNRIEKIDSLENLVNLDCLDLESNKIEDILPLQNLIKLERLELSSNQISNLTPLQNLTVLTRLTLENNQIQDIETLRNLSHLTYLSLSRNQVEDISPLQDLQKLTNLYAFANKIQDITALSKLKFLEALDLRINQLNDAAARFIVDKQNFPHLRYLYLANNPFQNIPEGILKLNEVQLLGNLRSFLTNPE